MSNMHGTGGDRARLTGTRGGKDQFNWSNVKSDESRELYLGHSVHAPVGRWQKGRDLNWYAKKSTHAASAVDVAAQIAAERRAFKQQEEDQRLEALGMKPRKNRRIATGLDEMEKKQLLERGQTKEVEYMTEEDRMGGLGSEETHKHEGVKKTLSSMLTKINTMDQGAPDALPGHIDASLLGGRDSSAAGKLTARKEKKREAQERKKAKKIRKKEKKLKRKDDELRELDKRIAELQRQTSNQREGRHRSRSGSRGRKSSRRKSKSRSRGREDARSRSGSRRGRSRSRSPKRSRAR